MLFIALLPFIAAYFVLQKASLITATLHYRASLRSTTLHFISPSFVSALCSPPAAILGSPAHRHRLRGCHAFCGKEKSKSHASPLLQAVAIHCTIVRPVCHRWLNSQRLEPHSVRKPLHCISLIAATLADACSGLYNLLLTTRSEKTKNQLNNLGLPNTPNIIAKLQVWLPKLSRVRCASLKKSSFFFCKNQEQNKKSIFWSALASMAPNL